jgi:hypothetical protein
MRGGWLILLLAVAAAACSRPSSREFFMPREKAEYGDTYSFILDLADSAATFSLDFFTRLERGSFEEFPTDDIALDLRWFSPSDSILIDTAYVSLSAPAGSAYYTKDYISPYSPGLDLPESGEWRLKAKVVNHPEAVRGVGVILRRF